MNLKRLLGALLTLTLATACIGPRPEPEPGPMTEAVSTSQLTAEIGPEGGELVAPADSPLAGLRLKVPPGALTAKVKLTVDGSMEATQLGGTAEQVGPQFIIGPADATFASPLELTVPISEDALELHKQGSEECKVWHFHDGAWTRLERTSGDASSVTVALPSPGAAAAGVLSRTSDLTCITNPTNCLSAVKPIIIGNDCVNPSGYCLVKLPTPTAAPVDLNPGFAVVNRKLFYAHVPSSGRITVARYDLVTGQTVVFTSLAVPGLSSVANIPVAVEDDGSAWLGLQQFGNVRFRENQTPFSFDVATGQLGKGVVVTSDDHVVRFFTKNGAVQMTEGNAPLSLAPLAVITQGVARTTEAGTVLALSQGKLINVNVATGAVTEPFTLTSFDFPAASLVNDGIAGSHNTSGADVTTWLTVANGSRIFQAQTSIVTFDAEDTLTAVSTFRPELRLFEATGGEARVPLTTAASGTAEFDRLAPRALIGIRGRKELLYVARGLAETGRSREFYLLQKGD